MPRAKLARMNDTPWRPSEIDPGAIGFVSAGIDRRFDEACRRLDVTAVSAANGGYAGRTRGAEVAVSDGSRFWLKVLGVASADNAHRAAEIESDRLRDLPKPVLVRQVDWHDDGVHWTARLEAVATAEQDRLAPFETATDGFTFVNASLAWRPQGETGAWTVRLDGRNLTDELGRVHSSFLKDDLALPGRNVRLTLLTEF